MLHMVQYYLLSSRFYTVHLPFSAEQRQPFCYALATPNHVFVLSMLGGVVPAAIVP